MKKEIKVEMPDTCTDCIFNYDGLDCRLFPEKYREDVDEKFDPYFKRPDWCQFKKARVTLSEGEV